MKRLLILVATITLSSCNYMGNKLNNTDKEQSVAVSSKTEKSSTHPQTKQAVEKRLCAIYSNVFGWYTRAEKDVSILNKMPDFDALYLSSKYKALIRKIRDKDRDIEAQGQIGFFDSDHWVCGQDFQGLSMNIVAISPVTSKKCSADINITNCGTLIHVTLDMVLEKGQWMIDDFRINDISEKEQMQKYLKSA